MFRTFAFVSLLALGFVGPALAADGGYRQGGASPAGICGPPDGERTWCDGGRDGAHFTEAWKTFASWD